MKTNLNSFTSLRGRAIFSRAETKLSAHNECVRDSPANLILILGLSVSGGARSERFHQIIILGSIVVSISACHVEDPGSIPGRGGFFFALTTIHTQDAAEGANQPRMCFNQLKIEMFKTSRGNSTLYANFFVITNVSI
jgi:hypothetical protein